jgi:methyl-accepting chemotaxis protein
MIKVTVGTKIGAGFALALAFLVIIGSTAYRSISRLAETSALVAHTRQVLEVISSLNLAAIDTETGERGYIITGQESYLEPYQQGLATVDQDIRKLRELTVDNSDQQRRLDRLEPMLKERAASLAQGISLRQGQGQDAARDWVARGSGKKQMDAVRDTLAEMVTQENELLRVRAEDADAVAHTARLVIIFGTIGAVIVLGLTGLFLTRDISAPLGRLSSSAELITAGDLSGTTTDTARSDEIGLLAASFERMSRSLKGMAEISDRIAGGDLRVEVRPQSDRDRLGTSFASMTDNLRRLTSELSEGIQVLTTSATEISTSTTQLAASATETATAVGETTTTVEELRQTAQVSSQKARAVSDTAQRISQTAQSGKAATEETTEGMNRIRGQMESIATSMVRLSEQSQAIGQIVATVDDLAAQSNLLAVNAAIEAAKAGEHGKGFAVVAQEVRSLAEQSRQATNQVRTILTDIQKATTAAVMATEQGSKAVEAGVKQSTQAGQSIQTLAGGVSEAAQAATQISASSQQQLVGVDQVASAMENIKQASLQNVDSARQLETAARDLKDLGDRLKLLTDRYKL